MELIQQELKFFTPITGKFSGFTETTDAIIPDSYPDINEVAFSCATINVKDELTQPERILVSGQIDTVILYRSSNSDDLYRLNIPLSFAHVEEAKNITSDALHFLQYAVSQVNVHIVNSRKISISCVCVVTPEFLSPSYVQLTTDIQDDPTLWELHTRTVAVPLITSADVKRFVILDDIEVPQGKETSPLHSEVELCKTECSVSNGRIIFNGNAKLKIWDMNHDGSISIRSHNIPFHQILDTNVLNDAIPTFVRLSCHSVICHYSNEDVLSINLNTEALFWQETQQEISWIDDLYHIENDSKSDFQPISIVCCTQPSPIIATCTDTLTATHSVTNVLSSTLSCTSLLPSEENIMKAILSCCILYQDENHMLRQLQKQQTYTLVSDQIIGHGALTDLFFSCEASAHENEIALQIKASGQLMESQTMTVQNLSDLTIASASERTIRPLKLAFIHENCPLWQIAKANRSTVHSIKEYNNLSEGTDQISNTILLIP